MGKLKPIPADFRQKAGYNLDRSIADPVNIIKHKYNKINPKKKVYLYVNISSLKNILLFQIQFQSSICYRIQDDDSDIQSTIFCWYWPDIESQISYVYKDTNSLLIIGFKLDRNKIFSSKPLNQIETGGVGLNLFDREILAM